jgi:hypothetical protein
VCRRSYVHPGIIDGFLAGQLPSAMARAVKRLRHDLGAAGPLDPTHLARVESAVVEFLRHSAPGGAETDRAGLQAAA